MTGGAKRKWLIIAMAALMAATGLAPTATLNAATESSATALRDLPLPASVERKVVIRGKTIPYSATASENSMRDADGRVDATISSIAYVASGRPERSRPVTFLFNGGPGSATIALREGLGPRTTVNSNSPEGFAFVDNPDSIFDVTDLVFIDAPGTGYGRFIDEAAKKRYWGVEQDARAIAEFIENWLRAHDRLASPKYLVGESYGGIRAAVVADMMAEKPSDPINFAGIILVSPSTQVSTEDAPMSPQQQALLALPSLAAVAQAHGRGALVGRTVDEVAMEARRYAIGDYAAALKKGDALPLSERQAVIRRLSELTGIPEGTIRAHNLLLQPDMFVGELLADRGERIGLLDGRAHAARNITDKKPIPYNDPSTSPYSLTYDLTKSVETMFRRELGFKPATSYVRLSMEANGKWDWAIASARANMPSLLKEMMKQDSRLKIFVTAGYYDLTIPYMEPVTAYETAGLPKDRLTVKLYPSGHSVFSEGGSRARASNDLRAFYGP